MSVYYAEHLNTDDVMCLREMTTHMLHTELPDCVVHQHRDIFHSHPHTAVDPAALLRPVLIALLLHFPHRHHKFNQIHLLLQFTSSVLNFFFYIVPLFITFCNYLHVKLLQTCDVCSYLFSLSCVGQHDYSGRFMLPNHPPEISHCLWFWAWK